MAIRIARMREALQRTLTLVDPIARAVGQTDAAAYRKQLGIVA
ncbi:MAG: hypothetical protein R3F54_25355 [Alphaproteobacteria bacterium]